MTEHAVPVPTVAELEQREAEGQAGQGSDGMPRPEVIGEGWSAVVVLPAGAYGEAATGAARGDSDADAAGGAAGAGGLDEASAMLDGITQQVDGGRILSTSLVTVLFADDGRVLVGAVPAGRLLDAAASGR